MPRSRSHNLTNKRSDQPSMNNYLLRSVSVSIDDGGVLNQASQEQRGPAIFDILIHSTIVSMSENTKQTDAGDAEVSNKDIY